MRIVNGACLMPVRQRNINKKKYITLYNSARYVTSGTQIWEEKRTAGGTRSLGARCLTLERIWHDLIRDIKVNTEIFDTFVGKTL